MFEQVILIGNLGKPPEMRYTPSGSTVTNFSLATSENWTDKDGEAQERTKWWRATVWGKTAENCNTYLKKGSRVMVQGRINVDPETGGPRIWMGRDGAPRSSLEITASLVKFLSSKGSEAAAAEVPADSAESSVDGDANIPF